jgi:2-haloalkanoic acid dehalogenase type II
MTRIRAITLDLDDTLWPVAPTIIRAEALTHEWLVARAPKVMERWPRERLRERRMEIHKTQPELRHDLLHIRRMAFLEAFAAEGVADAGPVVEGALVVFMQARNDVELYPEAGAVLERLAKRFPIASLTNGNADLARIGLVHHFRATVSAHAHGTTKPDPALFRIACEQLGCEPHEVVHVGDDPDLDVRGARAAGLHAVWVNRRNAEWTGDEPPVTVIDMEGFEQWLEGVAS